MLLVLRAHEIVYMHKNFLASILYNAHDFDVFAQILGNR